ncbi:MAG: HEAT repeat domain-containing protein [Bryobacterales bacterium]|nr:HEAT repeat domain-containing protein [Bryobacterales bacterium]
MLRTLPLSVALLAIPGCQIEDPQLEGPYDVPDGFVVEQLANDGQIGSLIQITFDAHGMPVVSKERGHPVRLLDSDMDGTPESQQVISDEVENCQGIWFDGSTLYGNCTNPEDGTAHLFRLPDGDGDGIADSRESLVQWTGRIGEHGPHDIRRAPDASVTVLLGNHTFVPADRIADRSPLRGYRESQLLARYMDSRGHAVGRKAPGGVLLRMLEGGRAFSLQFGGFRNPYNHAYNYEGEAFTFDSDMEWDINLPWYREVRSVHGIPSADFGWRTGSGKFPAYYIDSLPPVDDLGRGSPVGVDFYHSYAYPAEYFDAFLQGDWSRGRVVLSRFRRSGATYELAEPATDFIYGEPLNVTDLEVGPDGLVYFTMGGRMTRGGLYRVNYEGYRSNVAHRPESGVLAIVRQPQPLSAFSHAYFQSQKELMGEEWATQLQALVRDDIGQPRDRMQALHILQRYGPKPDAPLIRAAFDSADAGLRAAAIYVVGQHGSDRAKAIAADGLSDPDAFVRRRAAEALVRMGDPGFVPASVLQGLLGDDDRFVRWAARVALEETPRDDWRSIVVDDSDPRSAAEGMLALVRTASEPIQLEAVFEKALSMLRRGGLSAGVEADLLRVFHLACLEVDEGCRQSLRDQLFEIVAARFPTGVEMLDREYAVTMAYSGRAEAIERILSQIPPGEDGQPLQIHYVYCLREIKRGWTAEQKQRLLQWFRKAQHWRGGASFAGFINRLFESSLEFFDESEREAAYAAIPEFAPVDDEELLARLRRRSDHVQPNVFARRTGTRLYSEQEIFEYMMYDPMTTVASIEDGVRVYEEACAKCHRLGDLGKDYGPDLTTLGNRFTRRDMLESVLWPSREISDQYGSWRVETKDDVYSAMILEEDEASVTLLIPDLERPVSILREDIVDIRESDVSIMPEGLLDPFQMRETAGLFRLMAETSGGGGTD